MKPEIAFGKLIELQNLTKKNLVKISSNNKHMIDPSCGLNYGTLLGKALHDINSSDQDSHILPMVTNALEPLKPFTSAVIIPCTNDVTALGCLINCNHDFKSIEQELNDFSLTLISLGSLLMFYSGKNLVSKDIAGDEMPMPLSPNPTS